MAKALALTPDTLRTQQITPQAATPARVRAPAAVKVELESAPSAPKEIKVPLQVRLTPDEATAIKYAALDHKQTISEFVRWQCLHAKLRLSREDMSAFEVAAAEQGKTVREFMLACFHAYMKAPKNA